MSGFERRFPVLAAVLVLAWAAAGVAHPAETAAEHRLDFEPSVPDEYRFEEPTRDGVARVDGAQFDTLAAALSAAEPGDTVSLSGRFDERVVVRTRNLTITSAPGERALLHGGDEGDVLTVAADGVTIRRLWIAHGGRSADENDAGVWVNASHVTVVDSRVTDVTFGVWLNGGEDLVVRNNTIVGRESVRPLSYRGNGIQVWNVSDSLLAGNRITDVRDGIYYSWATAVEGRNNTMWDLRYGVHYMYSDDCQLLGNTAFDNDVGYALMVSEDLRLVGNVAVNNTGTSGHGILVKSVDETTIEGNHLVANEKGLYVYNSLDNRIVGNLVLANEVGIHLTAGSVREHVAGNSFVANGEHVRAVLGEQVAWNASGRGNYWSGARTADIDGDGVSEVRYRPVGAVRQLAARQPAVRVYESSPAVDLIRLAERTIPVVRSPGIVDHHPLAKPPHDDWRRYYA